MFHEWYAQNVWLNPKNRLLNFYFGIFFVITLSTSAYFYMTYVIGPKKAVVDNEKIVDLYKYMNGRGYTNFVLKNQSLTKDMMLETGQNFSVYGISFWDEQVQMIRAGIQVEHAPYCKKYIDEYVKASEPFKKANIPYLRELYINKVKVDISKIKDAKKLCRLVVEIDNRFPLMKK